MPKNDINTMLDSGQIVKRTFDETHDATRIVFANGIELAIELNAEDGDNVLAKRESKKFGGEDYELSCKGFSRFTLYSKEEDNTFEILISPEDEGDEYYSFKKGSGPGYLHFEIAARRMKVISSKGTKLVANG